MAKYFWCKEQGGKKYNQNLHLFVKEYTWETTDFNDGNQFCVVAVDGEMDSWTLINLQLSSNNRQCFYKTWKSPSLSFL